MPDQLITQCPKCSTSFRINDAQLAAAKGAVRCGACLTVFSALDNLVSDNTPPSIARANDRTPSPAAEPSTTSEPTIDTTSLPEEEQPTEQPVAEVAIEENQEQQDIEDNVATEDDSLEENALEAAAAEVSALNEQEETEQEQIGTFEIEEDTPEANQGQQPEETDTSNPDTDEAEEGLFDADDLFESTESKPQEDTETTEEEGGLFEFEENTPAEPSEDSPTVSAPGDESTEKAEQESLDVDPEEILLGGDIDDDALFEDSAEEKATAESPFGEEEKEDQTSEETAEDFSDTFLRLDSEQDEDQDTEFFGEANDSTQVTRISTDADESWTEALLEDEDTKQPEDISADELELAPTTEFNNDQSDESADAEAAEIKDTSKEEPLVATREPEVQDVLSNLEASPVEFHAKSRSNIPWGNIFSYGLGSLLCCFLLLLEYAWYDFYNLSRNPTLRPWYTSACNVLPCELPAMVDVSKVRSANLVIRSHPKNKKALVVDAIITNNANFEQPFPLLELTFSDFSDQIVASRRFKPYEYLDGELAGAQLMPAQTPIHIALEIYDPGKKAVNYHLAFHPANAH